MKTEGKRKGRGKRGENRTKNYFTQILEQEALKLGSKTCQIRSSGEEAQKRRGTRWGRGHLFQETGRWFRGKRGWAGLGTLSGEKRGEKGRNLRGRTSFCRKSPLLRQGAHRVVGGRKERKGSEKGNRKEGKNA